MVPKRALQVNKTGLGDDTFTLNNREILNLGFFGSSKSRLLDYLLTRVDKESKICWICTVNPEFMMLAQKEPDFEKVIRSCDIRVIEVGCCGRKSFRKKFFFLSDGRLKV